MTRKTVYLALAAIGTIVPYAFFFAHVSTDGANPASFISSVFANGAAGGFAADLIISSVGFWAFLFYERESRIGLYIALNLVVGLSCALPAYLYARERAREHRAPVV